MREVMLTSPIYWINEKKTKKSTTHLVGMNFYRNAHFHVKNKMKQDIEAAIITGLCFQGEPMEKFFVEYSIYYKNPSSDPSNIVALIEKFLLDVLQEYKVIKQDNVHCHKGSIWEVAGIDKENPRCEIIIREVTSDE